MAKKKKAPGHPVDVEIQRVMKRIKSLKAEIEAAESRCRSDTAQARRAIERYESILKALRAGRHGG